MDYKALFRVVLGLARTWGVALWVPVACVTLPSIARAASPTLSAPATVAGGAEVKVSWTCPCDGYDRVHIVRVGTPDGDIVDANARYANVDTPAGILAPENAGQYEIRYYDTNSKSITARRGLVVTPMKPATLAAPATAVPGSSVSVSWTGPANYDDHLVVVPVGSDEGTENMNISWIQGSPSEVLIPGAPGEYEIRYLSGQTKTTLARSKIRVTDTSATLRAPAQAVAGSSVEVAWTGPGNSYDTVAIVRKGAPEDTSSVFYTFVTAGSPLHVEVPPSAGDYELRYLMAARGQSTLARAALRVTPAKEQPGFVRVTASREGGAAGGAVELILDTSGSMLQRLGSHRRIDIAKDTLTRLTSGVIPPGTPFALRVFGRGQDSCLTDLEIPLQPLDTGAASARIGALAAKNNAKTPIGAALASVASDLGSASGDRVVVLVTDGEETCGGDPAEEILKLRQKGVDVRVNIVGFAVDDAKLASTFRLWSKAGDGSYFDARDAAGLTRALTLALAPAYDLVDGDRVVASGVVGGEPVSVMPGEYTVRAKGPGGRKLPVSVRSKQTSTVGF